MYMNQPLQSQWAAASSNPNNHNSIIENLSTLRSSDINERERNLLDKIKVLKQENKTLMGLLKESESMITEKIGKQKKETDQIMSILNKTWPLLMKSLSYQDARKMMDA